jgi:hypothetical protein
MHEASLHEANSFVTLTYDNDHMPPYGSLQVADFQKFMKRLRKRFGKVRFFHCGEYGEHSERPHYHALLFGFDFPDKYPWAERNGSQAWRSEALERLWPFGLSEIGEVNFESAAYVARYCVKKVTGSQAEEHYARVDPETGEIVQLRPEYATMSRNPGIGKNWIEKYHRDTYVDDKVIVRGKAAKPPRYYDIYHELVNPDGHAKVLANRQKNRSTEDETPERLAVREACAEARLKFFQPREGVQ